MLQNATEYAFPAKGETTTSAPYEFSTNQGVKLMVEMPAIPRMKEFPFDAKIQFEFEGSDTSTFERSMILDKEGNKFKRERRGDVRHFGKFFCSLDPVKVPYSIKFVRVICRVIGCNMTDMTFTVGVE